MEARREQQLPGVGLIGSVSCRTWVLGTEPELSKRGARALKLLARSLTPYSSVLWNVPSTTLAPLFSHKHNPCISETAWQILSTLGILSTRLSLASFVNDPYIKEGPGKKS